MEWCSGTALDLLVCEPPADDVGWAEIAAALVQVGCTVERSYGLHLAVELGGRVAQFQHGAVGTVWSYQAKALLAFLRAAP
jgi:hypothetical protein